MDLVQIRSDVKDSLEDVGKILLTDIAERSHAIMEIDFHIDPKEEKIIISFVDIREKGRILDRSIVVEQHEEAEQL